MRSPSLPESLAHRFEVVACVGVGAQGEVYRARDRDLGRDVAIKLLRLDRAEVETSARVRLAREAEILAKNPHPAIVPILDANLQAEPPYLVAAWMPGGDLASDLEDGPWELARVVEAGIRLAGALDHLHTRDVQHRDVKLENVLLDDLGRPYLTDLGLGVAEEMEKVTRTGNLVGTPRYLAPEVIAGLEHSPAADVFALAIALLELAAGRRLEGAAASQPCLDSLLEAVPPGRLRDQLTRALGPVEARPTAAGLELALKALAEGVSEDLERTSADDESMLRARDEVAEAPAGANSGEAPREVPEASARSSWFLGAGLGASAVLGLVLVALLLGGRPGSVPPAPSPQPAEASEPSPERARLEDVLRRILRDHQTVSGDLLPALGDRGYRQHEYQVVREWSDARMPIAWRRLFGAASTWAATFPPTEAGQRALDAAAWDLLDRPLRHLRSDLEVAKMYLLSRPPLGRTAMGRAAPALDALGAEPIRPVRDRFREIEALVRDVLTGDRWLREPAGPRVLAMRFRLMRMVEGWDPTPELPRALQVLADRPEDPVTTEVLVAGLASLPSALMSGTCQCAARSVLWFSAAEHLRRLPPGTPPALELELGARLMTHWFNRCIDPLGRGHWVFAEAAAAVEETLPKEPELALHLLTLTRYQMASATIVSDWSQAEDEKRAVGRLRVEAQARCGEKP